MEIDSTDTAVERACLQLPAARWSVPSFHEDAWAAASVEPYGFRGSGVEALLRYKESVEDLLAEDQPMAVVIKDVPDGYNWGWWSNEEPRMHVHTVDDEHRGEYKIWLETGGQWCIDPATNIPSGTLEEISGALSENRRRIQARWASYMLKRGWLRLQLVGETLTIHIYSGKSCGRTEQINLKKQFPGIDSFEEEGVDFSRSMAAIVIGSNKGEDEQEHIPLPEILWKD